MIFTTTRTKAEAGPKRLSLEKEGFNVGLVQDLQTLSEIGVKGMLYEYAAIFGVYHRRKSMTKFIELWDILRQCCGLQMSSSWRNQLLPSDQRNPAMKSHPICGNTDIGTVERNFTGTHLYKLLDQFEHARMLITPSGVDGRLDGTYCSRYNAEVTRLGLGKLNDRSPKMEDGWHHLVSDVETLFELILNSTNSNSTNSTRNTRLA
eukprot:CAMPEP_0183718552 /NCGR_PEP_ID=MMETSP0737-20130205/11777_1 /TAXON_ID=385413 /ORGANISM="Thalassiosira miniscula, Strain CCMP1093" /LENGTH=205 /DNA_ID=CAMNT_0025948129 /DNA_START=402 /DNA_END=1019 /DNA_ORIENTATION=-